MNLIRNVGLTNISSKARCVRQTHVSCLRENTPPLDVVIFVIEISLASANPHWKCFSTMILKTDERILIKREILMCDRCIDPTQWDMRPRVACNARITFRFSSMTFQ